MRDLVHERGGLLDCHLLRAPRRVVRHRRSGRHHRPRRGDAVRPLRAPEDPSCRVRSGGGDQPRHAARGSPPRGGARGSLPLHDRQPGLGRPGTHPDVDGEDRPAAPSASTERGRAGGRRHLTRHDRRGAEAGASLLVAGSSGFRASDRRPPSLRFRRCSSLITIERALSIGSKVRLFST